MILHIPKFTYEYLATNRHELTQKNKLLETILRDHISLLEGSNFKSCILSLIWVVSHICRVFMVLTPVFMFLQLTFADRRLGMVYAKRLNIWPRTDFQCH